MQLSGATLRDGARRLLRRAICERAAPYASWSASAVVFAPHQDDETLGCGGTIAKKVRAGASVRVVFMTDGSGSHRDHVDPAKLREMRRDEAIAACRSLGVPSDRVSFLGIEDGTLTDHASEARRHVREVLSSLEPSEVFVPHHADEQIDHVATGRIVRDAVAFENRSTRVYEYPVWFWHRWPWVDVPLDRQGLQQTFRYVVQKQHRAYAELNVAADVRDVLAQKRAALAEHRSQMQRHGGNPHWPTLEDVAGGAWLRSFFEGYEFFCSYEIARAREA